MRPNIYFFNPTCELAVANGSVNFMASAKLRRFEDELGILPGFLALPEDMVIVGQQPSRQFTDNLESAGFALPSYCSLQNLFSDSSFLTAEKGFLFPWGWSPSAYKQLSIFKSGCSPEFLNSPVADWHEIHRELYSRRSSLEILNRIVSIKSLVNILPINDLPEICATHEQIVLLQRKWGKVVVKSPWSASGRGLQVLRPNEYNQTNRQVIAGFLKQQGYVIAGPWHDKLIDLSFQFFSLGNGQIEYRGLTSFSTDHSGRYLGNFIQEFPPEIAPETEAFLKENIHEIIIALQETLTGSNYSIDYYGWLGVDAMIFRSAEGKLKFHPCLEINCRFTMGAIALKLRDHLAEHSVGEFRITYGREGQFLQYSREMMKKEPLLSDHGKIVEGFLPLTPAATDSSFGAWMRIGRKK